MPRWPRQISGVAFVSVNLTLVVRENQKEARNHQTSGIPSFKTQPHVSSAMADPLRFDESASAGRADSPRSEVTQAKQREQHSRTPHSPTLSFGLWAHDERQLHHLGLAPLYLKQPLISRLQDLHGSIPKYPQLLPPACRNATCAAQDVNVWWKPSGPSQPFPHNNKLTNKEHKHIGSLTYWKHSSFLGKVSMRNFINYWMTFK